MKLQITYLQENDNGDRYHLHEEVTDLEDTYFDPDNLYRSLQKEFGRCISKVYVDTKEQQVMHVGWVFQKRKLFRDEYGADPRDKGSYLAETWVSLLSKDETIRVREYHNLGR